MSKFIAIISSALILSGTIIYANVSNNDTVVDYGGPFTTLECGLLLCAEVTYEDRSMKKRIKSHEMLPLNQWESQFPANTGE